MALAEEYMEVVPGIQKFGVQDNKHIGWGVEEDMAGEDRAGDIEGILHKQRDTGFLVIQSNQATNKNLNFTRIKIIKKVRWRHDVRMTVKKTQQKATSELFTCVHPRHFGILDQLQTLK